MGRDTHDVVAVRWGDVNPGELQPCDFCCGQGWVRRHDRTPAPSAEKPCLVRDDDSWWPGTLTWESGPRGDGLWWANVRYRCHGRDVTGVRSQHDLRQRR